METFCEKKRYGSRGGTDTVCGNAAPGTQREFDFGKVFVLEACRDKLR